MNINIRREVPADYKKVEEVTREAFWNLYCPGCNEHLIIHKMRNHSDFIPELSFVIELDEEIVGSIFYTHSKVIAEDGTEYPTITFGPVSILPQYQRKGLGRALISYSIKVAKELGYKAILIGGYPYHYHTYGFKGTKTYNITMPDGQFYKGIMALPLYEGALDNVSGSLFFSDVFETDAEELEVFDKKFPSKEKKVKKSQKEFEMASMELDE